MRPSIGRSVHYVLSAADIEVIKRRRTTGRSIAVRMQSNPPLWPEGAQAHIGNDGFVGQHVPMTIVVVWPNEYGPNYDGVNGQAVLDGTDVLWVTSVKEGSEPGTWHWPEREE